MRRFENVVVVFLQLGGDVKQEEDNEDKCGRVGNRGMKKGEAEKMVAKKAARKLGSLLDSPSLLSPKGVHFLCLVRKSRRI